ncbi:glycosyltransferase family 2 protein, partial [Candidatus Ruminimicrobium bovinum]|uniref:glycosyltransferase family 2 protein n=1 Tax=Candidatus Ruminimicrobium bovinum TaxID=3242779 RepID=UPI0039B8BF66
EKNIITKEKTSKTKDEFIQDLLGFQKSIGTVWGKIFNSKYLKNNILLFDEELVLAEDAEFCLRLMKHNPKIIYIPNILYHYNLSNVSTVRTFNKFYFNFYSDSLKKIELSIDKTKYLTQWNNFVAHHLLLICVNYCFNLQNKVCYDKRKRMLKEILKDELFADSIRLCDSKDFPFTKKITLFFLKHKMYLFVYIISIIRNKTR